MSGGGGMSYGGEGGSAMGKGGGLPSSNINCSGIFEKTIINSPQEEVISSLVLNDVLEIQLSDGILKVFKDEKVAGSLTPPILPSLINCIEKGYRYIAIVVKIDDGACQVEIRVVGD